MDCPQVIRRPMLMGMVIAFMSVIAPVAVARPVDMNKGRPASVVWLGGYGLWSDPSNWVQGFGPIGHSANVFIDNGNRTLSTVLLDLDTSIADLSIDWSDAVQVLAGRSLMLATEAPGVLDLDGDFIVGDVGQDANLLIGCGESLEIHGSGGVHLMDSFGSRIIGMCRQPQLINAATIDGAGQIGAGTMHILNNGIIDANRSLELITIAPIQGDGGVINSGVLQASQGGNLWLTHGQYDNTFGVIRASDGSHVDLINPHITGGTLETLGTGIIRSHALGATLTNVTLNGQLELGVVRLTLWDQFTNNGLVEIVANNSFDGFFEFSEILLPPGSGDVTLKGDGEIRMFWGEFHSGSTAQGGRLIHDSLHTIRGAGYIGNNTLGFTNRGTVISDRELPLVIDPVNSLPVVNTGILRSTSTGGLVFTSGTFVNNGVIEVLPSGRCVYSGTASIGNISGSALVGGIWNVVAGDLSAMILSSSPSVFFNAADVTLSGPNASFALVHSIANNSGRFTLDDRRQFSTTNTFFSNDGYFAVKNGSKLTVNGTFSQSSAAETHIHLDAMRMPPGGVSIKVNGTAAMGGTLRISAEANINNLQGQTLQLISFNSAIGGYHTINTPPGIEIGFQGTSVVATVIGCPLDLNGDGVVGADDMMAILQQWGNCMAGDDCSGDLNHDGLVNSADITVLMSGWGPCYD